VALDVAFNTWSMAPPASVEYAYSKLHRSARRPQFSVHRREMPRRLGQPSGCIRMCGAGFCELLGMFRSSNTIRDLRKARFGRITWAALVPRLFKSSVARLVRRRVARKAV
jgi:hypothetical protein